MLTLADTPPNFYKTGLRPLLFNALNADPERLHQQTLGLLAWLAANPAEGGWQQPLRRAAQSGLKAAYCQSDSRLSQTLWGLHFDSPLGLAAGFDKDGQAARAWPLLGFGFAELGTVTAQPQPGNPQPRLFRLPADAAALNRMGFNNQGATALAKRLEALWHPLDCPIPLGINLGKSKVTPLEQAAADYLASFKALKDWGSYFVVNVSSPNTPGLRMLQARDQLEPILAALQSANRPRQPLLVKISPDLADADLLDIINLAQSYELAGIIATNTTISREHLQTQTLATGEPVRQQPGGISGAPVRQRATEVIRLIYQHTQGQLPIIGVGGIFSAADAWAKITAGASLVQVYTGWVYEGPGLARQICQGLLNQLDRHGLKSISQAVGLNSIES